MCSTLRMCTTFLTIRNDSGFNWAPLTYSSPDLPLDDLPLLASYCTNVRDCSIVFDNALWYNLLHILIQLKLRICQPMKLAIPSPGQNLFYGTRAWWEGKLLFTGYSSQIFPMEQAVLGRGVARRGGELPSGCYYHSMGIFHIRAREDDICHCSPDAVLDKFFGLES